MPDSDCTLGRIDPLLLAWAAGFFDGEGSTLVSERAERPGYRRLDVSVPQSGHDRLPEVLLRFQAAVLGMGRITGPEKDDMYVWRANGFAQAQATIALLWSQLGPVKRWQAAYAFRAVQAQYDSRAYLPRGPRRRRPPHSQHNRTPYVSVTTEELDLAWAAGFLDGEGHFGLPRSRTRRNAADWHRIRASATQNGLPGQPPAVLFRMQRIFGRKIEVHGEPDDYRWLVEGVGNVETVFMRVRPWLGTVKQEQARSVIERFRAQTRIRGDAHQCIRGHEYSRIYMSPTGPKRRCNACERIVGRMKRAAEGIKPRQFKNAVRRYNL